MHFIKSYAVCAAFFLVTGCNETDKPPTSIVRAYCENVDRASYLSFDPLTNVFASTLVTGSGSSVVRVTVDDADTLDSNSLLPEITFWRDVFTIVTYTLSYKSYVARNEAIVILTNQVLDNCSRGNHTDIKAVRDAAIDYGTEVSRIRKPPLHQSAMVNAANHLLP